MMQLLKLVVQFLKFIYHNRVDKANKAFKRDSQRVALLLCVGFCGYGVMR